MSEPKSLSVNTENIFYRWNEHYKIIEAVDAVSGKVIALQTDYNDEHILNPENMLKINLDGRELLVQKGMSIVEYNQPRLSYSKPAADIILQRIAEGDTLSKAIKGTSISRSVFLNWCDKIPSLADALNKARSVRAEILQDTIMETADEMSGGTMTKGELEGKTKAVEIMKWAAEKDSPARFGSKKDTGQTGATVIQIITGVTRDEPVTIEVKNEQQST